MSMTVSDFAALTQELRKEFFNNKKKRLDELQGYLKYVKILETFFY